MSMATKERPAGRVLWSLCVREIRRRDPPKSSPQKKKHYQCKCAFTCNQSELLVLNEPTKAVIHTDSFVRDGGVWEMPAGGKGLKAEGRQLLSLSCPPTFTIPLAIHYCHSVPPRRTPVLKSLLFKSRWA